MREDFCAFILTHGRPDNVRTYGSLREAGYTGRIYLVVDDEDRTAEAYRERYGDEVLVFDKRAVAAAFDEADNFQDRRSVFYARNACRELAERVGARHYVQLDDDYTGFYYRWGKARRYGVWRVRTTMDACLEALLDFALSSPAIVTVAMSQGGDHVGGGGGERGRDLGARRKAMNSFVCSVDRPFPFLGRVNEDVSTYVLGGIRGGLFLTTLAVQLNQLATQSNDGGMTEMYLDSGTYVKSFYSVMHAPSAVRIGLLYDPRSPHPRLHHRIDPVRAHPCVLREEHRRRE